MAINKDDGLFELVSILGVIIAMCSVWGVVLLLIERYATGIPIESYRAVGVFCALLYGVGGIAIAALNKPTSKGSNGKEPSCVSDLFPGFRRAEHGKWQFGNDAHKEKSNPWDA